MNLPQGGIRGVVWTDAFQLVVVWAGRGACPHDSHALARGAVPATASGPSRNREWALAHETLGSSRDSLAWRGSS